MVSRAVAIAIALSGVWLCHGQGCTACDPACPSTLFALQYDDPNCSCPTGGSCTDAQACTHCVISGRAT